MNCSRNLPQAKKNLCSIRRRSPAGTEDCMEIVVHDKSGSRGASFVWSTGIVRYLLESQKRDNSPAVGRNDERLLGGDY